MGLNNRKLPEAPRRQYNRMKGGAMYGMQPTIASAMIGRKPCKIVPATWIYRSYRKDVLVKGGTK